MRYLVPAVLSFFAVLSTPLLAAAANDDFANAQVLPGSFGTVGGDLTGATLETGEPNHGGVLITKSIWYTFTPAQNCNLLLNATVNGGGITTVYPVQAIAVYTGNAVNALTLVQQVANINPSTTLSASTALETMSLTSGTQYMIAVASSNTTTFTLSYNVLTPPSNDSFANAVSLDISNGAAEATGNLSGATLEAGEPASTTGTVWYSFNSGTGGNIVLKATASGTNPSDGKYVRFGAYTGSAVNSLTTLATGATTVVGFTNGITFISTLTVPSVPPNTVVSVAIAKFSQIAPFSFTFDVYRSVPPNDNFANAIALSGSSGTVTGSNIGATVETGEPSSIDASVWFDWTVPSSGDVQISASDSLNTISVTAFTGNSVSALSKNSLLNVPANTVLHLQVGSKSQIKGVPPQPNVFTLNYQVYPAPSNDNFANATVLNDTGDSVSDNNFSSTVETGEPAHSASATVPFRTVWYKWTVPAKANIKIYVTSDDFNTELGVYTGTAVNALTAVAKSDDIGTATGNTDNATDSGVSLSNVAAGTVLMIAVGSASQAGIGDFDLTTEYAEIGVDNPANDNFANAEVVTLTDNGDGTFSGSTGGDNTGAGAETGEPTHSLLSSAAFTSVWYKFTMPIAGGIQFNQDNDDLRMAVYIGSAVNALTALGRGSTTITLNSVAKDTVLFLAVDGRTTLDFGSFTLTADVGASPANDNFANAEVLTGGSGSVDGSTLFATTEAGDPTHNAVWYTWTLPSSGYATIDAGGQSFSVFTGTQLTSLSPVFVENNDSYGMIFAAVAGTTVKIAVSPPGGVVPGDFTLSFDVEPIPDMDTPATVLGELNITDFGADGLTADGNFNYDKYKVGKLPSGVSMFGDGEFFGVPTQPGEFAVSVTGESISVSDPITFAPIASKIITNSKTITFKIFGAPSIDGNLTALGFVNTPFAYTVKASGFPAPALTVSALPDGLTFNGVSILGTPTTEGVTNVTITAQNQFATATATLVITIESARNIDAFAGDGFKNPYGRFQGDGGPAVEASLNEPVGIAIDSGGHVFIADVGNNRIRRVSIVTNTITTVVGGDVRGFSGDGGLAADASLDYPAAVTFDSAGNMYIADTNNHRVRKVDTTGVISTIAGSGSTFTDRGEFGGDGGAATIAKLNFPSGVVVDAKNQLYIADAKNGRIRRVDLNSGTITTYAGNGARAGAGSDGIPATDCRLGLPTAICLDAAGNLYISDTDLAVVRKVDAATGIITRVAGVGGHGYSGDGQLATKANLYAPTGIAIDKDGNLIITDSGNNAVRRVNLTTGIIATIAGKPTPLGLEKGMSFTEVISVLDLSTTDVGDAGASTNASLSAPMGVAYNAATNTIFISDTGNQRVRAVGLTFNPNPTAAGQTNIDQGKVAVVNPLSGVTIDILKSDGGAVELQLSLAAIAAPKSRDTGDVEFFTDFDSAIPGRTGRVGSRRGSRPAITFTQSGVYHATVVAKKKSDGSTIGNCRKMIVITNRETGQAPEAQDTSTRNSAISGISVSGKFNFADNGTAAAKLDSVKFSGSITLPPGYDLTKVHELDIGIGNVVDTLRVDKTGKPIFLSDSLKAVTKFAIKYPKASTTTGTEVAKFSFTMALKDLDVAGFESDGISPDVRDLGTGQKSLSRKIQVAMLLGGVGYSSPQVSVTFTPNKVHTDTQTAEGGSITGRVK